MRKSDPTGAYVLRGARTWDGIREECSRLDIEVRDGLISRVGPPSLIDRNDPEVDCSSLVVIPGMIDCHVHLVWDGSPDPVRHLMDGGEHMGLLHAAQHCREQLLGGVTTVRDLGSSWDAAIAVASAVEDGALEGSRVIAAGRAIIMTGGHDPFWGHVADGPAAVRVAVRKQWSLGARVIKMAATGGAYGRAKGETIGQEEFTYEELRAGAEEAHRLGLRVAAHALGETGIANAVRAGIDTIEHGTFLSEEIAADMAARGTALCPTLLIYQTIASGLDGIPSYACAKAAKVVDAQQACIELARAYGVRIIAGTDAGSCATPHPSLIGELKALRAAGLSAGEVLRSATSTAGEVVFPGGGIGVIRPGFRADLLVLRGDPREDLDYLSTVELVIRGGKTSLPK